MPQDIAAGTEAVPAREKVDKLKSVWLADPCWDIDDTEGFEHYREELKAFREEQEAKWEAQREQREREAIDAMCTMLGTENRALAKHFVDMQGHYDRVISEQAEAIERLSDRMYELERG
ncbi:hypothetical protein ACXWTF_12715 [Thiomicrolovo sp. ZZH C-3]